MTKGRYPRPPLTTEEKLLLLASGDVCNAYKLSHEESIPIIFKCRGFQQTWEVLAWNMCRFQQSKKAKYLPQQAPSLKNFSEKGSKINILSEQRPQILAEYYNDIIKLLNLTPATSSASPPSDNGPVFVSSRRTNNSAQIHFDDEAITPIPEQRDGNNEDTTVPHSHNTQTCAAAPSSIEDNTMCVSHQRQSLRNEETTEYSQALQNARMRSSHHEDDIQQEIVRAKAMKLNANVHEDLALKKKKIRKLSEKDFARKEAKLKEEIDRATGNTAHLQLELRLVGIPKNVIECRDDLCFEWESAMSSLLDLLVDVADKAPKTTLRRDRSLAHFHDLMRLATSSSATITNDNNPDKFFLRVSNKPTDHNLVLACFVTHVLKWCFDTDFHVDKIRGTESMEIFEAAAVSWGLKAVRFLDTMRTVRKTRNPSFVKTELLDLAKQNSAIFRQEFSRYLSLDDKAIYSRLEERVERLMKLKLKLLVSPAHYQIAFLPPGTMFNGNWMIPKSEAGGGVSIIAGRHYRVSQCLAPALLCGMAEPDLTDLSSCMGQQNFRDALLETRKFFVDASVGWGTWPDTHRASRAIVIVKEVPEADLVGDRDTGEEENLI